MTYSLEQTKTDAENFLETHGRELFGLLDIIIYEKSDHPSYGWRFEVSNKLSIGDTIPYSIDNSLNDGTITVVDIISNASTKGEQ